MTVEHRVATARVVRVLPRMGPNLIAIAAVIPATLFGVLVGCLAAGPSGFLVGGVIAGLAGMLLVRHAEMQVARDERSS